MVLDKLVEGAETEVTGLGMAGAGFEKIVEQETAPDIAFRGDCHLGRTGAALERVFFFAFLFRDGLEVSYRVMAAFFKTVIEVIA